MTKLKEMIQNKSGKVINTQWKKWEKRKKVGSKNEKIRRKNCEKERKNE